MRTEKTAYNSTLAIGGVPSPLDSFEVAESSVLRTNFSAEKPAHRQSANRCASQTSAPGAVVSKKIPDLKLIPPGYKK